MKSQIRCKLCFLFFFAIVLWRYLLFGQNANVIKTELIWYGRRKSDAGECWFEPRYLECCSSDQQWSFCVIPTFLYWTNLTSMKKPCLVKSWKAISIMTCWEVLGRIFFAWHAFELFRNRTNMRPSPKVKCVCLYGPKFVLNHVDWWFSSKSNITLKSVMYWPNIIESIFISGYKFQGAINPTCSETCHR